MYRPLIIGWLNRQGVPSGDLEDLSQDTLLTVVKHLPTFHHSGRRGSFRSWLRTIVCSRTSDYWRAADPGCRATAGAAPSPPQQIADPESDLNRQWDEEHDRYVLNCLLDLVEEEFEPTTLQAFGDWPSTAPVARRRPGNWGCPWRPSTWRNRASSRIRQEAEGLID